MAPMHTDVPDRKVQTTMNSNDPKLCECGNPKGAGSFRCKTCANRLNGQTTKVTFDLEYVRSRSTVDENGCWRWDLAKSGDGYGVIGKTVGGLGEQRAHRAVFRLVHGDIVHEIDHTCRVRDCVNPDHLEDVPHGVNCGRARNLATHCPSGHPFTPENSYADSRGYRRCRQCRTDARLKKARLDPT